MFIINNSYTIKLNILLTYIDIAAVSISPVPYVLGAGGIGVWDEGQDGPCMGRCMGWFGGSLMDDVEMMWWGWEKCSGIPNK